ncbi:hypothetical protein [Paenibacillus sp. OAS669]|uniref:hypothetical protein n=1 Tax=Paenibacillus sp. OAS669 TaxID=2663821 RepID=UPI001788FB6F|nr:hypothetical protein [Paenibacillus sp. OAS669]MBE1446143.1 hypothetical protein [Paenibacillus sp. OAS669]
MTYFSKEYEKFLAEHFVYDAWQFVLNVQKNVVTAGYCCHVIDSLISKMEQEHKEWQDNINHEVSQQFSKTGAAEVGISYDNLPQFKMDMFGITVDYPFLIDKYVKDFFQYLRNALDAMAQVINSALLANNSGNIEKVDYNKIITVLKRDQQLQVFTKSLDVLERIQSSSEFNYLTEFNNKIKHISDAKMIMSRELFGDGITNEIGAFFKKGNQFSSVDIQTITKSVYDYISNEIILLFDAITEDIKLDAFIEGRIHKLQYYWQMVKDDPRNSFNVIFTEVNNSIDELNDVISILFVKTAEEDISSLNCDYEDILVRDKDENYVGRFILDEVITDDGLFHYRKYKKDTSDGHIAFIEQANKKYPIKPLLMDGKIVRVGFNQEEEDQ